MHGFQAPPLNKTHKVILGSLLGIFFVDLLLAKSAGFQFATWLSLSATTFLSGHVYQVLTYPLVQTGLFSLIFNGLVFWFIGCDLERLWGTKFYIKFLVNSTLATGVFYIMIGLLFGGGGVSSGIPLLGMSGLTYGLLTAYGIIYSDREMLFMFLFPLKAKYFCLLLGLIELFTALSSPYAKSAWAHLFTMGFSFFYLSVLVRSGLGARISRYLDLFSPRKRRERKAYERRSQFHVVSERKKSGSDSGSDSGDDNGPRYWH